jgi:hypothetical protein
MILGKYSNRAALNRALLAAVGGITLAGGASAQLTSGLVGYYDLDGTLANNATTVGGVGGSASLSYAGLGSTQFLLADSVPDTTSFFPPAFGGLGGTDDAIYLGGDTADLDHFTIPGLTLGSSDFTVSLWAAMGEDQSAGNSGSETTGGNGPSIFGNTAVSFEASGGPTILGGGQGFSYGVWSSDGDDYTAYAGDGGSNSVSFGDQDVGFDTYVMHSLVYDATAQTLSRYQGGFLRDTLDVSSFATSLDNGNDLRIGGFPEPTSTGSDTFWGAIDDVSIWNRTLDAGELATIGANGSAGFDLEDVINGNGLAGVALDSFTGAAGSDNNFSTDGNWDNGPSNWGEITNITVADGTTAGNPAVIDTAIGSVEISTFTFGADGVTTDVVAQNGTEIVASGISNSFIGDTNSTLNLTMNGSATLNHVGQREEGSQLDIARAGSTVNLVMNNDAVIASGTFEQDASYATGFRRPLSTDTNPQERLGDDIDLGNGGELNLTMNGNSLIFTPDVFYPHDSDEEADVTVVQNDNSKVVVNWDTRFFDTGFDEGDDPENPLVDNGNRTITWTLNDNAQFLVARDHGLGEAGIDGNIIININDNALFYAGGRIAAGAGFAGSVEINQTGGRLQAGSAIGSPGAGGDLTVDGTGVDSTGIVRDGVLWMGEGASSVVYNLSGGSADITRTAFVGADGAATINQSGGVFTIYGNGTTGDRDGNDTVGIPITTWTDGGGDLFLGRIEGDSGIYNLSGGTLSVARDIRVGFDSSDGVVEGGSGEINISGTGDLSVGQILAVGNVGNGTLGVQGPDATINVGVLAIGGIGSDGTGSGTYKAAITGSSHSIVNVVGVTGLNPGDVFLTDADIQAAFADGFRPASGDYSASPLEWKIVDYAGTRTGIFNIDPSLLDGTANGAEWDVRYDDPNGDIFLQALAVYTPGDADLDGDVDSDDFNLLAFNFDDTGNWAAGDFDGDGVVGSDDFNLLAFNFGAGGAAITLEEIAAVETFAATIAVPEPSSLALLGLGGLLATRRRRSH